MQRFFFGFFRLLKVLLDNPLKVLWLCLALAFVNLVLDGSLLRLWSLHRDHKQIQSQITEIKSKTEIMQVKLAKASDPAFIQREAIDRFDLVGEGELVFVFSEED